ncbi:hypothetical protein [Collimonas silvisoli]|uniref:hypothetical protein n=1 Tax=Collimonas silvisoli TaxID=2825884 RepID=UPI001B8AC94F|nr:hypothetical protein [Collimonas silvisoli]
MKKIKSFLFPMFLSLFLLGCATAPPHLAQKQANRSAIEATQRIEIFYHPDQDYPVLDAGGSSYAGLSGLLGPIGMIAGLGAHAASKTTMVDRARSRSADFTKAVHDASGTHDFTEQFAQNLAEQLRLTGREVKLTKIERPTGDAVLSKSKARDMMFTPGYTALVLRTSKSYVAESATSSYRPVVIVEFALMSGPQQPLIESRLSNILSKPTYITYSGLLDDAKQAADALDNGLLALVPQVQRVVFDMNELSSR